MVDFGELEGDPRGDFGRYGRSALGGVGVFNGVDAPSVTDLPRSLGGGGGIAETLSALGRGTLPADASLVARSKTGDLVIDRPI